MLLVAFSSVYFATRLHFYWNQMACENSDFLRPLSDGAGDVKATSCSTDYKHRVHSVSKIQGAQRHLILIFTIKGYM